MTKAKPAKIGRPSIRTERLIDQLCKHLAEGKTLRAFCRLPGKPTWRTLYNWSEKDLTLSARLARAREIGTQMLEDEVVAIADGAKPDSDDVARCKLRIYAREKVLAWFNPGKYGAKVGIGGASGLPPLALTDTERLVRLEQLLRKAGVTVPGISAPAKQITVVPTDEPDQ